MPILDNDQIRRLEHIAVDGRQYKLHIGIRKGYVHSVVIGQANDGSYLPQTHWYAGVYQADRILGDTSEITIEKIFPHCALIIQQENEVVQIRTRAHYEIDFNDDVK